MTKPQPIQTPIDQGSQQMITATGDEDFSQDSCKFCYQNEKQSQEKLISPCGCSGSLKFVHKECLKKWLNVEANRRQGPLADVSLKLRKPDLKCKLCAQQIIFQNQLGLIGQILRILNWVSIINFIKKVKYYACISILGSLAINYYFLRFFMSKFLKLSSKIKDNSFVSLIILSLILILLELTFIQVTWNANNLQISVPLLNKK